MHNPRNTLANSRHKNRCSETAPAMAPRPSRVLRQTCASPFERSRDYCADSSIERRAFRCRGLFYQYDKKRAVSTSPRTSHQHARVYSPSTACRAHPSDHTPFCTIHACPDRLTYAALANTLRHPQPRASPQHTPVLEPAPTTTITTASRSPLHCAHHN